MRLSRVLLCLLLVLLVALPAAAQDTTEEAPDARAVVEQALANFAKLSSYHFAYKRQTTTILTADEETTTVATILSVEGDALANHDNFMTISIATNETLELAEATPPLHVERTIFNGKSALNFQLEDSVYEDQLPFEQGWQSYEDFAAAVDGTSIQIALDNINNTLLPTAFFTDVSLIESVTEVEPEAIDDVNMHVMEVKLNALGIWLERTPAETRSDLQARFRDLDLIAASELTATLRLWIGADDGQIYKGLIHEAYSIPYLSSGHEDQAPYDLTASTSVDFTISAHGEPVEIEPVILPE